MTAWHGESPVTIEITMPGGVWYRCGTLAEKIARLRASKGIGPADCAKARLAETQAEIAATAIRVGLESLEHEPESFDLRDGARITKEILRLANRALAIKPEERSAGDIPGFLVGIAAGLLQHAGMTSKAWVQLAADTWNAQPDLTP